jgi:hypothetical protein
LVASKNVLLVKCAFPLNFFSDPQLACKCFQAGDPVAITDVLEPPVEIIGQQTECF